MTEGKRKESAARGLENGKEEKKEGRVLWYGKVNEERRVGEKKENALHSNK